MSDDDRPLELTEARSRSELLRVRGYEVHLDLSNDDTFGSRTRVDFAAVVPGASTFIELKSARAISATLNGVPLPATAYCGNRLTLTDLTADNVLVVEATLPYVTTGEGMHRYVDPLDGASYVSAYLGVDNGQRVFACFDQPDLKAPITATVAAPDGWRVVSNGRVTAQAAGRWAFATTPPISPYLFALVAGPLHSIEIEHRGIPFAVHCRRSLGEHLDREAVEILELTRQCFDRYAEIFTEPYPFDSYEQAFVPELNWGAMESPGCVTLRDEFVYRSAVAQDQRQRRGMIIAHEMAHMWFGNLVTMRWWDDVWLSESFAEYMGHQVLAEATRFRDAWTGFAMVDKPWGYDADQRASTHPVAPAAADVTDTDTALANFDGISYAKGASALHQLAAWLGDSGFLAGLNLFLTTHRFDVATLDDFLAALTSASSADVPAWADDWLRTTGVDNIGVGWEDGVLHLTRPGRRTHRLDVGVYDQRPDGLVPRVRLPVTLTEARVDLPLDGPEPALVLVNESDLTYATTTYPAPSLAVLRTHLSGLPDSLGRAVVWTNLRDMVRSGSLDPAEHLDLVASQLPAETNTAILSGVLDFARLQVADRFLDPARRDAALDLLRRTCRTLATAAGGPEGADRRLIAARGLIESAASDVEAAELADWLVAGSLPDGPELDSDLRWRILLRLSVLGRATPDEVAAAAAADLAGTGPEWAARCAAARPTAAAKSAAWHLLVGDPVASNRIVGATLKGFWQPEQVALLAPYADRYYAAAQEVSRRRGSWLAAIVAGDGFPFPLADRHLLLAGEACLADPGTTPALRRKLADQLDELRRVLRVRGLHGRESAAS